MPWWIAYSKPLKSSVLEDNMKFPFYMDPGHGWLKVPMRLLKELGIEPRITAYSYRRGDFAYLEEDCDATTFVKAMEARDDGQVQQDQGLRAVLH